MVKNIQTNTFLGSVFDEEHAGSHNFAQNPLHHRHFDVQKKIVLQLYYVVQRSTCGGAQLALQKVRHAYTRNLQCLGMFVFMRLRVICGLKANAKNAWAQIGATGKQQ